MKIALVHDWLTGMRGGEKCLEALCRQFPGGPLLTLLRRRRSVSPTIERMAIGTSWLQSLPFAWRYYRWLLPLMPAAVESLRVPDVDLVLSFSHAVAKSIRPPLGVPHVCYCFTPMRYAWQRRADYVAGRGPLARLQGRLLDRVRDWDRRTSARVTHFVAISQTVARRIADCYGRTSRIVYPPVDTDFFTPGDGPRGDYYVALSALVPYKRVDVLIDACTRLRRRLIVVGDGPERRRLAQRAGPTTTLVGRQSDAEVRRLLRGARAMLFAANEDFGIAPLEAQACGTPVIAFGEGGATETILDSKAGRGSGRFFAEQTAEALIDAIVDFEREGDGFDPAVARRNAERFSTPRFEAELVDLLEAVVAGRVPPSGAATAVAAA